MGGQTHYKGRFANKVVSEAEGHMAYQKKSTQNPKPKRKMFNDFFASRFWAFLCVRTTACPVHRLCLLPLLHSALTAGLVALQCGTDCGLSS
jgi:hypothetical protein